eukprot:TRINITY_DN47497_c0_g1_i1.p2 TRINITY_DN47497_c0_g1~~TRINITY_DN47497_c0_g1_i1.p2  ORF type:complete len:286 (+),score=78.84 TRINITY_DN47497_c0_g1_i1:82-939(+)
MSLEVYAEGGNHLCSPCFDSTGRLWVCSKADGGIYRVSEGQLHEELNSGGQPHGLAFDGGDAMHIADVSEQALVRVDDTEEGTRELRCLIGEHDGAPLRGPSAVAIPANQKKYFTDSGALGDSTLANRRGGVYVMDPAAGNTVRALLPDGLAHPCALCVCPKSGAVYCAEMLANRVLRFVEHPAGAYHCSVFAQLAGTLGPSCLDCDGEGNLYVGHYELRSCAAQGRVTVMRPTGEEFAQLAIPGAELTGLCFDASRERMYVTEASEGKIWQYTVPQQVVNPEDP